MKGRCVVIGAGRQGTASAYDLAVWGNASSIILADADENRARAAASRINRLVSRQVARGIHLEASDASAVLGLLKDADGAVSAVPYRYNLEITELAIQTKTHLTDLGGNEQVVLRQLALDQKAVEAGISIIPDCGMGPGMTGSLAAYGISKFDQAREVFIWDGGLPLNPTPPWNFALTFHVNGLTNEYDGEATFIRDGKTVKVPTFTELEQVDFPPLGKLEAFVTSGGASSAHRSYLGKLQTYQNKTLRYPGHFEQFRAYKLLGLFEENQVLFRGQKVAPRDFFHLLLEPKIKAAEDYRDICLIRVVVRGLKGGIQQEFTGEIIDRFDEKTGFTAMERLTGWHAAIMLEMALEGKTRTGVRGLEQAVDPAEFMTEVKKRNISVSERLTPLA